MDGEELANLRLDYDQTHQTFRLLSDIRFKLLAFVPPVSAALITFLTGDITQGSGSPMPAILVGLLGFFVVLGIVIYELRNSEIYAATIHRGKLLETILKLPPNDHEYEAGGDLRLPPSEDQKPGGLFLQRGKSVGRLLPGLPIKHDVGLALIYGAVLGAWVFPITKGLVTALQQASVLPCDEMSTEASLMSWVPSVLVGIFTYARLIQLDKPGRYVARLGYPEQFERRSWWELR